MRATHYRHGVIYIIVTVCSTIINSVAPPAAKGFILLSHYSRDSFRQGWPKRKLTTKFYDGYPIDFSKDQKRNLLKRAQKFLLEDGALFFIGQKNGQPKRWVHSRDEQQQILKACHSDKLAGHFGRDKTRREKSLYLIE